MPNNKEPNNKEPNSKMYFNRKTNIAAYRGCNFNCIYCAFKNTLRFQKCTQCKKYEPHAHIETLLKNPPQTKDGEFIAVGMNGDVAFASKGEMSDMIRYCKEGSDRTFMMQSKDPRCFLPFDIPENLIICTTIETNWDFTKDYSKAPITQTRMGAMCELSERGCETMITIEPIMKFSQGLIDWLEYLQPKIAWVGYDSKNNHLPEPTLSETNELIYELRTFGIDVREKLLRKAWDEV